MSTFKPTFNSTFKPTIVLATGNLGKVKELDNLLSHYGFTVKPQSEFNVSDADETGTTFIENAIIKARHAAEITGLPAIADDSGLEVDALNGAPGIYSARYSGANANDALNNTKLLQAMADIENRSARFHCVLVFMKHHLDPTPIVCHGVWEGEILTEAKGDQGFGYDPLFWLAEQQMTSAELPRELKNQLSHRGQALKLLVQHLEQFKQDK